MKFWDADVKKLLGTVNVMIDEGNTLVFNSKRSYIRNDLSGEEIEIKRKGGTFVVELSRDTKVQPKRKEEKGRMEIGSAEEKDKQLEKLVRERYGDGEVGFRRQAR